MGSMHNAFVVAPLSERARVILKAQEELLGLLQDVPESEYELSLTDLVEKKSEVAHDSISNKAGSPISGVPTLPSLIKERSKKRYSRSISSSEGVLLNMYMPTSLSRTLTASRSGRLGTGRAVVADHKNSTIIRWMKLVAWMFPGTGTSRVQVLVSLLGPTELEEAAGRKNLMKKKCHGFLVCNLVLFDNF